MQWWLWLIILLVAVAAAFFSGITYRKKVSEREISSAEEEARRIINEAIKTGESKQREALLEAKEKETRDKLDEKKARAIQLRQKDRKKW